VRVRPPQTDDKPTTTLLDSKQTQRARDKLSCCAREEKDNRLEGDHLSLALLVTTQLEVLASANALLLSCLALGALHTQRHLLRGLGLSGGGGGG
jgi:hypothetical protein